MDRIKVWAVTFAVMGQGTTTAYFDSKEAAWTFYNALDVAKDAPAYCGAFNPGNQPALWRCCEC